MPLLETNSRRPRAATLARSAFLLMLGACGAERATSPAATTDAVLSADVLSGAGQVGAAGAALPAPLRIRVRTGTGAPAAGRLLSFVVTAGGGSVFAATVQTDASGLASQQWTLGTAVTDSQQVEVRTINTSSGMAVTLATVSARATAAAPAVLERLSPDSQRTSPGASVPAPPALRVLDRYRNPVTNTPVHFSRVTAGGALKDSVVTTDSVGHAQLGAWTVASRAGINTLRVQVDGASIAMTFTAYALEDLDPTLLAPLPRLASGATHTCALTADGSAYCWGSNFGAVLGVPNGSTAPNLSQSPTPQPIDPARKFVAITAGNSFSCGLTTASDVLCWGSNYNSQIGSSQAKTGYTSPGFVYVGYDNPTPLLIDGALKFMRVSAGNYSACALTLDGTAYCWGTGTSGQLGRGDYSTRPTPVQSALGLRFVDITVGYSHACGLQRDGSVFCWGANNAFQLGYGPEISKANVALPLPALPPLVTITAGTNHTCGIGVDSTAYCWEGNFDGQLGDGTGYSHSAPTAVIGGHRFLRLYASNTHTCGLRIDGQLLCWGGNEDGSLGDGTRTTRVQPTALAGARTYSAVTARCGVATNNGGLWCWGPNDNFQTGFGAATTTRSTPVPVGGLFGVPTP